MCFSAEVSFGAGVALLAVGAVTVRKAARGAELPFAAIPLLFGVQQIVEGGLWVGLQRDAALANAILTQVYSLFSHVLWPAYVPLAAWALEPRGPRRHALTLISAGGIAVGAYLLYNMFANPILARPVGDHIDYDSPHFYAAVVMTLYLTATTGSMLLSSRRVMKLFGALALAGALAAWWFYARWFISVWCFFAAVLSLVIWLHFAARNAQLVEIRS
jgi:hypothetical protein